MAGKGVAATSSLTTYFMCGVKVHSMVCVFVVRLRKRQLDTVGGDHGDNTYTVHLTPSLCRPFESLWRSSNREERTRQEDPADIH